MQNKLVKLLRSNALFDSWLSHSRWAAPLRWLYALTQLVMFKRQIIALEQQIKVLAEAPNLPFVIEARFQSPLVRAEARVGASLEKLTSEERDRKFYTYFSEVGGENSQAILKQQHEFYLNYIPHSSKFQFLDIGCGSGEFIALLTSQGIPAIGIDMDEDEVSRAKLAGLNATHAEAVKFLSNNSAVYSGISMIQVIEHLPPNAIYKLLKLAVERLMPGGVLLIETINMKNPLAINGFYIDPTHERPVPDEYLGFLMEWFGLVDLNLLYSLPAWLPGVNNQDLTRIYYNYALVGKKRKEGITKLADD